MHQSILAVPRLPPPPHRATAEIIVSPGGGAFPNFALPGGWAFAIPGAFLKILIGTRFPIRL